MTATPEFRFPTIPSTPGSPYPHGGPLPVYPESSIYESIAVDGPNGTIVHTEVERIMARPKWNFEEAKARLEPSVQKALKAKKRPATKRAAAKKAPAKKAAAKKRTPSSPDFQRGSEGGCYS